MLKVWREDEGEGSAIHIDMGDPELAACKFADEDSDGAIHGDYWGDDDQPVIIVEDADGIRTRWLVEATTEHIASPAD